MTYLMSIVWRKRLGRSLRVENGGRLENIEPGEDGAVVHDGRSPFADGLVNEARKRPAPRFARGVSPAVWHLPAPSHAPFLKNPELATIARTAPAVVFAGDEIIGTSLAVKTAG